MALAGQPVTDLASQFRRVAMMHRHPVAVGRERGGDGLADATRRTCHQYRTGSCHGR
jgi:hypothetical protein